MHQNTTTTPEGTMAAVTDDVTSTDECYNCGGQNFEPNPRHPEYMRCAACGYHPIPIPR